MAWAYQFSFAKLGLSLVAQNSVGHYKEKDVVRPCHDKFY